MKKKKFEYVVMPHPGEDEWQYLRERYDLPELEIIDGVRFRVPLPPDWFVAPHEIQRGDGTSAEYFKIYDQDAQVVGVFQFIGTTGFTKLHFPFLPLRPEDVDQ